ncbi:MAG: hypothetical protein L6R42_000356 [Xanthoria sp. 1 TBL-2021]|nr:MAG: hypothetical protein L6R42_000356 [Xanthoria sp. 1 TBL-2021]
MPSASMKSESIAHILSKNDYNKQSIVTHSSPSSDLEPPLPPSAVRMKTTLIALTANNLGYAALGTQLHWWDAFPVPPSAPPPFNDSSAYGIVPSWGYATVVESTIKSIPSGSLLWGCWPLSTHSVILQLKATSPQNHWLETSDHRKNLMPLYQRYVFAYGPPSPFTEPSSDIQEKLARTALLKPLWEAAYLLNRFVFSPPEPSKQLPMHPFGSGTWTAKDGDLSSAIVVIVAAASKTATAFASEVLSKRAPGTGPLAILSVASKIPDKEISQNYKSSSSPALRNATYASMTAQPVLDWLSSFPTASKIRIVDFGGSDSAADTLASTIQGRPSLASKDVTIIGVGGVHKPNASAQWKEGRVPSNASTARDAAVERVGADVYWRGLEEAFEEVMERGALGLDVRVGTGMRGEEGVEGGWETLCEGKVSGRTGLAFWI